METLVTQNLPSEDDGRGGSISSSMSPSSLSSHASRNGQELRRRLSQGSDGLKSAGKFTNGSGQVSQSLSLQSAASNQARKKNRYKSQYPRDSSEPHVEYILVASFHIDRGPIMEHQYPSAIGGDESMLAELMLPDQTHVRSQDWTIFFLHKEAGAEEENERDTDGQGADNQSNNILNDSDGNNEDKENTDANQEDEESPLMDDEPPLMYVLNLVNTKQDSSAKRGAVVKAMAICTRHPFLHIYKPLLLLALEDYFKSPYPQTLATLYNSLNSMDISLMPRLSYLEKHILLVTESKDLFIEKFEKMIKQRMDDDRAEVEGRGEVWKETTPISKYSLPRDTHEFESKVFYHDIAIPVKVPTAISPETVGDFSLIKLIQTFSGPHATTPQAFPIHPHLTSSGPLTHPIIVLVNALLTQKRVIFLGHNRPSGDVAEVVLAACALVSGGVLRGFTRHAFPYTDLTKIDELLKVPGFVAGVTNPAFANHPEWWDVLCDLPSGRIKISSRIDPAPLTEGMHYFQPQGTTSISSSLLGGSSSSSPDLTGDVQFMDDVLRSIASRHGEGAIRAKWRTYITKFVRIAASFEEIVYGATALHIMSADEQLLADNMSPAAHEQSADDEPKLRGHGYVWLDEATKQRELAAWVPRIEGWRNTRSYYHYIQGAAAHYLLEMPLNNFDIQHHHDRLRTLKLSSAEAGDIYIVFSKVIKGYNAICQLLSVTPQNHAGLFYITLGLYHPDPTVRDATVELLDRIATHEVGRHFWSQVSRFTKLTFFRKKKDMEEREAGTGGASPSQATGEL